MRLISREFLPGSTIIRRADADLPTLTLSSSTLYEGQTQGDTVGTFTPGNFTGTAGAVSLANVSPSGAVQMNVDGRTLEYGATPIDRDIDLVATFDASYDDDTGTKTFSFILDVLLVGQPAGGTIDGVFETDADETAPTLSSPVGTKTGQTTADGGVTTDEGNGTLYMVTTQSATQPSAAQIAAGTDEADVAADFDDSLAVSAAGVKTFSITGLTANTTYYNHYVHVDAAGNASTVVSSASFTTDAASSSAPTYFGLDGPLYSAGAIASIGWATGHAADDVAILLNFARADGTFSNDYASLGWTDLSVPAASAPSRKMRANWKRATSGAEASVGMDDSGAMNGCVMLVIRGCRTTGAPVALLAHSEGTGSSNQVTVPSGTTSGDNHAVLIVVSITADTLTSQLDVGGFTNASLASVTTRIESNSNISTGIGVYAAIGTKATAGALADTIMNTIPASVNYDAAVFELIP